MLTALGVFWQLYWLLLASRLLAGLFSSNLTIAQASVVSLVPSRLRARFASLFGGMGALGWVIGGLITVVFSGVHLKSQFALSWPPLIIALLFLLCVISIWITFPHEQVTLPKRPRLGQMLHSILAPYRTPTINHLLWIYFINFLGWMMYQAYLAAYLIEKFQFTWHQEAIVYLVAAIWFLAGAICAATLLLRHVSPRRLIQFPLVFAAIGIASFVLIHDPKYIWYSVSLASIGEVLGAACISALLGKLSPSHLRGRVFGVMNMNLAATSALGPLLAGSLILFSVELPYIVASLVILTCWGYILVWSRLKNKES